MLPKNLKNGSSLGLKIRYWVKYSDKNQDSEIVPISPNSNIKVLHYIIDRLQNVDCMSVPTIHYFINKDILTKLFVIKK